MMNYRNDAVYMSLVKIIEAAGITIQYGKVHDDSIDGEIWARADSQSRVILMPDDGAAFPDAETACIILGHEMAHILTGLESIDYNPPIRQINERTCDLIGAYLYRLADMTAETEAENIFRNQSNQD